MGKGNGYRASFALALAFGIGGCGGGSGSGPGGSGDASQVSAARSSVGAPNDPLYSLSWGLSNDGRRIASEVYTTNNPPGILGHDMNVESAWEYINDCSAVVVAVLDTGVDYTHPDLADNMWDGGSAYPRHGYDFVANDNDPADDFFDKESGTPGHGTHVAGIIGASGNNGAGTTGVCWRARIMAVRVANARGMFESDNLAKGIRFAVDNGADVINMSLTGEHAFDRDYASAIAYARDRDVVVVVAAGNGGADELGDDNDLGGDDSDSSTGVYPCNFTHENLICVAALDQAYQRPAFTNYGRVSVDVGAPGANVTSTRPGGGYDTRNGTSMAAPHVAGVAALLRAYDPALTYRDVVSAINNGGRAAPALEGLTTSGRAVDALGSLAYIDPLRASPARVE